MYSGKAVLNMVNICWVKLTVKSSGKKKQFSATLLTYCFFRYNAGRENESSLAS